MRAGLADAGPGRALSVDYRFPCRSPGL